MARVRKLGSVKNELVKKSKEAALCAIQVYNNPNISFKSETHIVLMIIAWTYLLHGYYRGKGTDYRYFEMKGSRKKYDRTKNKAYKYWELERCINCDESPIDEHTARNLRFLIGLRHEIEHQMTHIIDDLISAKLQACCLNYNRYLKELMGKQNGLDNQMSLSIHLTSITEEQIKQLNEYKNVPKGLIRYIKSFEDELSDEELQHPSYSYRVLFVPKLVNHKNQADKAIEFIRADSPLAQGINKEYAIIKETERPKHYPGDIVKMMKGERSPKFNQTHHTILWQENDAKNPEKKLGTFVGGKQWLWYDSWIEVVRKYCQENRALYI